MLAVSISAFDPTRPLPALFELLPVAIRQQTN